MKSVLFTAVAVALSLPLAQAQDLDQSIDPGYFTIKSMTIQEVTPAQGMDGTVIVVLPSPSPNPPRPYDSPTGDPELDHIINLGKMVWNVIVANKPVVNIKTDTASALPMGVNSWENLSTWQAPQARDYRVTYQNFYGSNVVDFTFRVLYTHGGSVNGRGLYLTNATILPAHLAVAWGYTFNAQSTVANVMNAGTSQDPVAAMQLQLHWSIDTVLKHEESTKDFYIKGDGSFQVLGGSGPQG